MQDKQPSEVGDKRAEGRRQRVGEHLDHRIRS